MRSRQMGVYLARLFMRGNLRAEGNLVNGQSRTLELHESQCKRNICCTMTAQSVHVVQRKSFIALQLN